MFNATMLETTIKGSSERGLTFWDVAGHDRQLSHNPQCVVDVPWVLGSAVLRKVLPCNRSEQIRYGLRTTKRGRTDLSFFIQNNIRLVVCGLGDCLRMELSIGLDSSTNEFPRAGPIQHMHLGECWSHLKRVLETDELPKPGYDLSAFTMTISKLA
jgi:hypothetical protein